ncbi:DUF4287 domain-containing protein [Ruania halotolerans]|uniref:DUF4287 domain-containing protein n=1 Tax=Ruania halotolerans TaxID=2897773 RepID=UPI001E5BD817|nr:DUF4287 domain-containing protein [Ruania halotolerans]UFU08367.1 DUF4287 domain-containing protein [Ruania halotolerans]
MSFQAYLDAVETKTGRTPRDLVQAAQDQGFGPGSKATPVATWLKETYGIGHGHAMAMVHVITKGEHIGDKHVGSTGTHRDSSNTLWLDGKDSRPADW